MWNIISHVKYFQSKLGNYDKQTGEQSVEQRILQDIDNEGVEENNAFLIDVDVIRGTVFAKNKPRHGWLHALSLGILRAAFAPFYWDYWRKHLSFRWTAYIMLHFILQFVQAVCFLLIDVDKSRGSQDDVLVPCLLAVCLGILHTHITAIHPGGGNSANPVNEGDSKSYTSTRIGNRSTSLEPTEETWVPSDRMANRHRSKPLISTNLGGSNGPAHTELSDSHQIPPFSAPTFDLIEAAPLIPEQQIFQAPCYPTVDIVGVNDRNIFLRQTTSGTSLVPTNISVGAHTIPSNSIHLLSEDTASAAPLRSPLKHDLGARVSSGQLALTEGDEDETEESWLMQPSPGNPHGAPLASLTEGRNFGHVFSRPDGGTYPAENIPDDLVFRVKSDVLRKSPLCRRRLSGMSTKKRKLSVPLPNTALISVQTANSASPVLSPSGSTPLLSEVTSVWHDGMCNTASSFHEAQSCFVGDNRETVSPITSNKDSTVTSADPVTSEVKTVVLNGTEHRTDDSNDWKLANGPTERDLNGDSCDMLKDPAVEVVDRNFMSKRRRSWSVGFPVETALGIPPLRFGSVFSTSNYLVSMLTDDSRAHSLSNSNTGALLPVSPRYLPLWLRSIPPTMPLSPTLRSSHLLRFYSEDLDPNRLARQSPVYRVTSSSVTVSSNGSTSSAVTECEKNQFRVDNRLDMESFHGIGAGLNANPVCVVNPPLDHKPSACVSKFQTDSDELQPVDAHEVPHEPGMNLSKSLINLSDGFDDTCVPYRSSKPVTVSKQNTSMNNGSSPTSPAPSRKESPYVGSNEDTFTAHSRQRAKFLRLFMQRASLSQNHHRNSQSGPSHLPKFHRLSTTSQLSRSTNVLNLNNAYSECDLAINREVSDARNETDDLSANQCEPNGLPDPQPDGVRSKPAATHAKHPTFASVSKKAYHLPNHYWVSGGKLRVPSSFSRGQTASETEFDRLNSDVGSDIDSSSGPDDVEPITPASPCAVGSAVWFADANDRAQRPINLGPDHYTSWSSIPKPRPVRRTRHPSGAVNKWLYSSRIPKPHLPPKDIGESGESGSGESGARDVWVEQDRITDSAESLERLPQPGNSLSNAEENARFTHGGQAIISRIDELPDESLFAGAQPTFPGPPRAPLESIRDKFTYKPSMTKTFSSQWSPRPHMCKDAINCSVWEGDKMSKFNLNMLEIGCSVIRAVERQGISSDYIVLACLSAAVLPLLSVTFHWNHSQSLINGQNSTLEAMSIVEETQTTLSASLSADSQLPTILTDSLLGMHLRVLFCVASRTLTLLTLPVRWSVHLVGLTDGPVALFSALWHVISGRWILCLLQTPDFQGRLVVLLGVILRFNLYAVIFFVLSIAERTFQQRLLYAKYFFSLTSARRARKYRVPQFRLNKLSHVKCWLTLRSYLKKRGPQRSVEMIIAAAFYIVFVFGLALCSQLLSKKEEGVFSHLANWDILGLTLAIMLFLHRFIILGTKITKKYRNFSVLITEQINLYLNMEKKPHKKDELTSTFQVLRLVESLLKEVDGPFRVCGWTVNPLVYNIFKLVLLSCFSSLLSETLGFKLKLYKLKLNAANW
ncbi:hypothetical protein CSKR_102079 [Clonorchis sinensis]|uniref:PHTF1/2 N-terminal domain-containing protein n=2 Tax=Opisthorchiidae TaxID=6196 RepID=A0A8T1MYS3_CLOSI|nr:hypothetical protein CSKR_102079 [Clonorchis sinensis]